MSPNDVKELLDALITELGLPLIASDSGPLLVSEKSDSLTQEHMDEVVKKWMDGETLSHGISVGRSVSERDKATTHLALDTHRVPEVKEILESLVVEQALPLKVDDDGFRLEILTDVKVDYRSDDMMKLETLLAEKRLDVFVRHNGFSLWQEKDTAEILFSQFETLATRLAAALDEHGLQVKLLHQGFELQKREEDKVDITEAKELTYRLENMVGIPYVQGTYGYIKPGLNTEIHWTVARITTALP